MTCNCTFGLETELSLEGINGVVFFIRSNKPLQLNKDCYFRPANSAFKRFVLSLRLVTSITLLWDNGEHP